MVLALAIGQEFEDLLDLAVLDDATQSHAVYVLEGDHDLEIAGLDLKQIELFDAQAHRSTADLFDDPDPMVRVYDLVTYLEAQAETAHEGHPCVGDY